MSTNTTQAAVEHLFNDDLLANEQDLKLAEALFPELMPVLDFPQLRETFRKYDDKANVAKRKTHRRGLTAVFLGTIGLSWTALSFLLPDLPPFGEAVGLLAVLIASGGLWLFSAKHEWLLCRLMTERVRQWHFQFILRRGDLVRMAIDPEHQSAAGLASFTAERDRLFAEFLKTHEGKLDSLLSSIASSEGNVEAWIVDDALSSTHGYQRGEAFDALCDGYRTLRLRHQVQYAQYKLATTPRKSVFRFFRWPPIPQLKALDRLEGFCFVLLIVVSTLTVIEYVDDSCFCDQLPLNLEVLGVIALCVAIAAFAVRTIEGGLGLHEEIGRYREYRSRTQLLLHDLDQTSDLRRRLQIMSEMERAAFDEMRHFLTAHHEATFVL